MTDDGGARRTPTLSNWGAFGDDDEIGTLNYLTADVVARAAGAVRTGERFPLNLPMNVPSVGPEQVPVFKIDAPGFKRVSHRVNTVIPQGLVTNDDHVVMATQGSSQWDAFIHAGFDEPGVDGVFYNGVTRADVSSTGYAHRDGIDKIAQVGIVGRGVLLDIARMVSGGGPEPLPLDHEITVDDTVRCMREQGTEVLPGDIVCFRTGWTEAFLDADESFRVERMSVRADRIHPQAPGITGDHATLAHEQRWSAVTADNPGIEAMPMPPPQDTAHVRMMRNLGIPFGELFYFRALAEACARDRRWDFMFVAVPLWIPGGAGSPANAIAIR